MPLNDNEEKCRRQLSLLEGDPFEEEAHRILGNKIEDYQKTGDKPQGDGGVDAFAPGKNHAYSMYGPEIGESPKIKAKTISKNIVDKFKANLQRILEVNDTGRGSKRKIDKDKNDKLEKVIGKKLKFTHIRLVVNCTHNNEIYGKLIDLFDDYKEVSECRYITRDCQINLWGPREIVEHGFVDIQDEIRLAYPRIYQSLDKVKNETEVNLPELDEKALDGFDKKVELLIDAFPSEIDYIKEVKENLLSDWARGLFLLQSWEENHSEVHKKIERLVFESAKKANLKSLGSSATDGPTLIEEFTGHLKARILETLPSTFTEDAADQLSIYLASRLVGECPIRWSAA